MVILIAGVRALTWPHCMTEGDGSIRKRNSGWGPEVACIIHFRLGYPLNRCIQFKQVRLYYLFIVQNAFG